MPSGSSLARAALEGRTEMQGEDGGTGRRAREHAAGDPGGHQARHTVDQRDNRGGERGERPAAFVLL